MFVPFCMVAATSRSDSIAITQTPSLSILLLPPFLKNTFFIYLFLSSLCKRKKKKVKFLFIVFFLSPLVLIHSSQGVSGLVCCCSEIQANHHILAVSCEDWTFKFVYFCCKIDSLDWVSFLLCKVEA